MSLASCKFFQTKDFSHECEAQNHSNIGAIFAMCHPGHIEIVQPGHPGSTSCHFTISSKCEWRPSFCILFFIVA